MYHNFSYGAVLSSATHAQWQIDDILPQGTQLDFALPFMPEALARAAMPGLSDAEALTLNHIRGHEYLAMFGMVEEFILPFLLDHMRDDLGGDERIRALLQFASEEAKHIALFRRFEATFKDGFAADCPMIGPSESIAAEILRHDPLSVALLILQIEWMTQSHYLDSVRDDTGIDPLFASLLRHHWIEEAQHAKLDTLIVEAIAARMDADAIDRAVNGYLAIGVFLDAGFGAQAELNLGAFERAVGRTLGSSERAAFLERQHQALRWTYIGSGMTHPNFGATLDAISPTARAKIDAVARIFS